MLGIALLISAIQVHDTRQTEFYKVMGLVVAFAGDQTHDGGSVHRQPTFANVRTLAALGSSAVGRELTQSEVAEALGVPATPNMLSEVTRCSNDSSGVPSCRVRDDGIYIDFNGVLWLGTQVEVILTVYWSQRSSRRGDHLGMSVHRLFLTKKAPDQWVIERAIVEAQT